MAPTALHPNHTKPVQLPPVCSPSLHLEDGGQSCRQISLLHLRDAVDMEVVGQVLSFTGVPEQDCSVSNSSTGAFPPPPRKAIFYHVLYVRGERTFVLRLQIATIAMFSEHSHLHRNRQTSLKAQISQSSFGG